LYFGFTTDFTKRKNGLKTRCNNPNNKAYNFKIYSFIRSNGGWDNWSMILIEYYPCNNGIEARARERYWYEFLNASLNRNCPNRSNAESKKEWNEKTKKNY
jgi:hypothetical protein